MSQAIRTTTFFGLALAVVLGLATPGFAIVIGNWEGGATDGWVDWSNGQAPIGPPRILFNATGATLGTGAIEFSLPTGGYSQWAAIKLQGNGIADYRPDFIANTKLAFDLTLVASEMAQAAGNDYATINPIINAAGYGFVGQGAPESAEPFVGHNGDNSYNPQLLSGTQKSTWVYDIGYLHDGNAGNGEVSLNGDGVPDYLELIFESYSNGGVTYHLDNVRFFTPVPEPTTLALLGLVVPSVLLTARRRRSL